MVLSGRARFKDENGRHAGAQNVMDNLIYRREIPVMIGVFINPGRTPEQPRTHSTGTGATAPRTAPPNTTRSTTGTRA
jgi:hypothetical protein